MALLKICQGPGCSVVMMVRPCLVERKKYCSPECRDRARRGRHSSPATEFQPGQMPSTWVPVGTERVRKGYVEVKVANSNVWRPRGHLAWERAHGRPMPAGWVLRRLDGDTLNDDPANLEAVSRAENLRRQRLDPAVEARWLERVGEASRRRWAALRRRTGRPPQASPLGQRLRREEQRMARYDRFYWEADDQ
jgi:hypothetical protein